MSLSFRADATRLFGWCALMLVVSFATALIYLRFATAVTAGGYDMHELAARRDELRREVHMLQLQVVRLDSPPRIEQQAKALGLEKAARITVVTTGSMVAGR
jgi:hypothetical protein